MAGPRIALAIRFWAKVDKTSECWLWTGATTRGGYGHIKIDGQMQRAHRVAYELAGQVIPRGFDVDHLCRTRLCVNPAHLEPVTRRQNIIRGVGPTARHSRQTHCKRGHEFTPENTLAYRGWRVCRACQRARQSLRRAA